MPPLFTKKHFEYFARTFAQSTALNETREELIQRIVNKFKNDNPKFKLEKFDYVTEKLTLQFMEYM